MSVLPSNVNQAQRFITDTPDWSRSPLVTEFYSTSISVTRGGLETRARNKIAPRYQIEYTISGLTGDQYFARIQQAMLDARAPLVVPLWTEDNVLDDDMTGTFDNCTLVDERRVGLFRAADYIYFIDEPDAEFRSIASVTNSTTLVLDVVGGEIGFGSGSAAIPCLICEQVTNTLDFNRYSADSREIKLVFRSIEKPVTIVQEATTVPTEGHSTAGGGSF